MTTRLAVVATVLVASVHMQALAKEASVDWAVNATIIDGCSCQLLCPCIFGSPATVGSAATHQHAGRRSCYFNAAFRVNKGHHGTVKLDGLKFWFAGDKGDAKTSTVRVSWHLGMDHHDRHERQGCRGGRRGTAAARGNTDYRSRRASPRA